MIGVINQVTGGEKTRCGTLEKVTGRPRLLVTIRKQIVEVKLMIQKLRTTNPFFYTGTNLKSLDFVFVPFNSETLVSVVSKGLVSRFILSSKFIS